MVTIGQKFAEERRRQGLTLAEISRSTKIREEFLRDIEKGDFKALPSASYAYGFVRNYAKFLGLPVDKSLAIYRREFDEKKSIDVLPRGFTNPKEYRVTRFKINRSTILIGFVFVIVLIFLLFQYRSAIFAPEIKVDYPKENSTVNSLTIEVKGKTDPDATLFVNDDQVSLDNSGSFRKQVTVFPGKSTIMFKAENRFGKVTILKRDITVKPGY
ncbi:MAG: helix-turn-helix domain-containing protein [Patescibacteria group bacterium]